MSVGNRRRRVGASTARRALALAVGAQFEPLERRQLLTSVLGVSPANLSIGVAVDPPITVTFDTAMNSTSFTSTTFELLDSSNNVIPARITYNAFESAATLTGISELSYATTYHVVVEGGVGGVLSSTGGTLAGNASFAFTTSPNPASGTAGGGPILVVTSTSNAFSSYYPEILRAEGFNEFSTADITTVTPTLLSSYSVVLLSQMTLTTTQVGTITTWVNNGGNLIAFRPDAKLDPLLGITAASTSMSDEYLLINTSSGPGVGITNTTMQYHGTADQYSNNGATVIATLYSSATTSTSNPAVTVHSVGTLGGQAAAFSFDLAQSVIETRQGNPAWAGQARDGQTVIRSDDLFFGASATDPEPNWVDMSKIQIPQADEEQRLLGNMITQMEADVMPLPKLWYLPNGDKAEIVLTGDDHDGLYSTTKDTLTGDQYLMSIGNVGGQPIAESSYMFPGSVTDAQAAYLASQGFELSLHTETLDASGNPQNWTSMAQLQSLYTSQLASWEAFYPSLAAPRTNRMHAVVWSDYASQPQVEYQDGIRLDTSYYYYPGTWANVPGLFTGSGLPQLFATASGQVIDVYQAPTFITDENSLAQWYQWTSVLLGNAVGTSGYYGAFTAIAHPDTSLVPPTDAAQAIIAASQLYNTPIISADDLLNFEDGRNGSYFSNLSWNSATSQLSFSMTLADQASGLQGMIPYVSNKGLAISSITLNGSAVPFMVQTIKGIAYAFYNAAPGTFVASYSADTTKPTVSTHTPPTSATNIPITSTITATFSEDVQASGISVVVKNSSNVAIAGTVAYDSGSHTVTFTPAETLATGATYTVTVSGAVDDVGNAMAGSTSWSFTTVANIGSLSVFQNNPTPATVDASDTQSVNLGMNFESDVAGQVTAIRFYKGPLNIGTHVGSIWTTDGQLLGQVTFTNETASGWQQANLTTPITIQANTPYIVSYLAPSGEYAADQLYFQNSGVTNQYLHGLEDGVDTLSQGLYAYGSTSAVPYQTNSASNYYVDVVFNATPISDSTAPKVTGETPASNASGTPTSGPITVTFGQTVKSDATLSISLKNGSTTVPGTLSYNQQTSTATFTPSSALAANVTYTVTVNAASLGSVAMSPFTWSFTTSPANTYTLFSNSNLPSMVDSGDPTDTEVGIKFQSSVSGFITGLKFYKAAANTGTHVGHLWDGSGNLLATVTFTNETASGWQTATFSQPVAITANTTYVISYFAPNGHYSATPGYFNHQFVTNGPLTSLISGDVSGNGVFAYSTGSLFPSQSSNASNYWVDPIFQTQIIDNTPPSILSQVPSSGQTNVATSSAITVTFSENVKSDSSLSIVLKNGSTTIPGTLSYNAATFTATFTPTAALAFSTTYSVTVNATDIAGNAMTPVSSNFTTAANSNFSIWGGTGTPTVTNDPNTSPLEVGTKFQSSVSGWVTGVSFYKGTQDTGTHVGHLWSSTGTLLATVTFSGESASGWQTANFSNPVAITANTTYVISYYNPTGHFASSANYFASNGVTNGPLTALSNTAGGGDGVYLFQSGGGFPNQTWQSTNYWVDVNFTTTPPVDNTPPSIASQSPTSGQTNVSTSTPITVTFSEAVKSDASLSITLKQGTTTIPGTLSYNSATFTATFTPTSALSLLTTYSVAVTATDLAGNVMTPAAWNFTTASTNNYSIWSGSATPTSTNDPNTSALEVGTKFQSSVSGWVTGVSFYKGTQDTGTHVGHLWSSTGQLLATVTFSGESASGWQTANFSNPVAITANTTYVISYYNPTGHFAANTNYFATSGVTNGPLTALSNTAGGGNGVFLFGTGGGFPNQNWQSTNYWVDVQFTTTPPVDNTPPTISSQSPTSGQTNVSTSAPITVTFSEAVKSDSSLSIVLKQGATTIPGTLSYNSATFTAMFTPTSALSLSTTYSVAVTSTDLAGNVMTPANWNFTTAASNTVSIWSGSATPSSTNDPNTTALEVGTKFQSSVAGWVTGVSFYKGTQDTGTHVGHLWSSTGTLLATVTFTGETASGWQSASFSNPVAITANTTYVISYYVPTGHFAANASYFATSGVTNGPLTALSNTAGGGNGVYIFQNGGAFPNQTWQSTNYWVDVNFTTTAPPDNTPPSITAQSPISGQTGVYTNTPISVTFSEAVKNDASLSVTVKQGATTVPGTLAYNATTHVATFTPTSLLAKSASFTVSATATDLAGNVMTPASWSFTTAATNSYGVFASNATPTVTSSGDATAVELGMKFTSTTAGFITGVRFYKGAGNTGTHVGHLWDSSGNLLATVTFTGETASGWQTAMFSTPVAITANTSYIISYYAPNGDYAADANYFASAATSQNGVLTAPATVNGLYRYGTGGGLPNATFQASNYWVDALFEPTIG